MAIQIGKSKLSLLVFTVMLLSTVAWVCWALPPGRWEPTIAENPLEGGESGVVEDDCPGELVCAHWVWGAEHGGQGGQSGPCCLTRDKLYATYVGACDAALRHSH